MSSSLDPKDFNDIPDPFAAQTRVGAPPPVPDLDALPPAPTRDRTRALRAGAVAAAIGCEAVLVATMGLRSGPSFGAAVVLGGVALPALAAGVTLAAVQGLSSRKRTVIGVLVASFATFVLTTLVTSAAGDDSLSGMLR